MAVNTLYATVQKIDVEPGELETYFCQFRE